MTRSVLLPVGVYALMGAFLASPAASKKSRFDARVAIFVTAEVPAQERNAALAKGILRELAAFLPKYSYLAGKPLRRKLRAEPEGAIARCEGKVDCIAKLGRRLKVAEVMVGAIEVEPNGAVLRFKVVDTAREKVARKVEVPITSEDALRPALKVRSVALFGVKPVGRVVIPGNTAAVAVGGKQIGAGPGPFDLPPGPLKIIVGGIAYDVEVEAFERTRLDVSVEEPPLLGPEASAEPELFVPPMEGVATDSVETLGDDPSAAEPPSVEPPEPPEVEEPQEPVAAAAPPSNPVMNKSLEEIMATMPGDVVVEGSLESVVADRGPTMLTWGGVLAGGAGVIALGTGVYFGLERQAAQDDLDGLKRGPGGDTQLEAERIEEAGDRAARRATIALAAGGALVAVGATLIAVDLWPTDSATASVLLDGTGASVQLGWIW